MGGLVLSRCIGENKMRIITGSARGKKLRTLEGDRTRPTAERVKEGLFSAIQFDIEGRKVLDLFAGSGQLGLEALSRGAQQAVFVDAGKDAAKIIEENIRSCGFQDRARLYRLDYMAFFVKNTERFDIAFLDPPYESGLLWHALEKTADIMQAGGVIICEHPAELHGPLQAGDFRRAREYRYGKIALTFYRHKDVMET